MSISEFTARRNLKALLDDFDKLSPEDRKSMSEASIVRQFIDSLREKIALFPNDFGKYLKV